MGGGSCLREVETPAEYSARGLNLATHNLILLLELVSKLHMEHYFQWPLHRALGYPRTKRAETSKITSPCARSDCKEGSDPERRE
jgi:hypothetical protein